MPLPIPPSITSELLFQTGADSVAVAVHDMRNALAANAFRFLNHLADIEGVDVRARGSLEPFLLDFVLRHYVRDPEIGDCVAFRDVSNHTRTHIQKELRQAATQNYYPLRAYTFKCVFWPDRVFHAGQWYALPQGKRYLSFQDLPPLNVMLHEHLVRVPVSEDLRACYRWLVKKYHPDRQTESDRIEQANDMLKLINVAYRDEDEAAIRDLAVEDTWAVDWTRVLTFEGAREITYRVNQVGMAVSFRPPELIADESCWALHLREVRDLLLSYLNQLDKVQTVVEIQEY